MALTKSRIISLALVLKLFLDQQLQQVTRLAVIGEKFVDKLVQVYQKGTGEIWVLIHIEIQSQTVDDFAQRECISIITLLYDRYQVPLANLGILGDDCTSWRPDSFEDTVSPTGGGTRAVRLEIDYYQKTL